MIMYNFGHIMYKFAGGFQLFCLAIMMCPFIALACFLRKKYVHVTHECRWHAGVHVSYSFMCMHAWFIVRSHLSVFSYNYSTDCSGLQTTLLYIVLSFKEIHM